MVPGVLALAVGLSGCAFMNEDNRRTLNLLDETIQPKSTATQIAVAPVGIVAGTAAVTIDIAVVHPVCVIPDAADDVYELYWKPRDMTPFRKALLFVPIVVLTPPTFAADWLGRSLFDIDD